MGGVLLDVSLSNSPLLGSCPPPPVVYILKMVIGVSDISQMGGVLKLRNGNRFRLHPQRETEEKNP